MLYLGWFINVCVRIMFYQIKKIAIDSVNVSLNDELYPSLNHAYYELRKLKNDLLFETNSVYYIDNHIYIVAPYLGERINEFTDKRNRKWEIFEDLSYYDMICLRCKNDKNFNSQLSFHFYTYDDAYFFAHLLKNSC